MSRNWGALLAPLLLILAGCSTKAGLICDEDTATGCVKHYCFQGQLAAGGASPMARGDGIGQIWSHGLVVYGEVPEQVQLKVLDMSCTGEPPEAFKP